MVWRKSPPELIALFDRLVPADPKVERRSMFGYPAAFVGGNLFASLFQDHVVLRLSESDRETAKRRHDAAAFEPMPGRPMRAFVLAPEAFLENERLLREWISRAMDYARTLPVKRKKAKKAPRPAAPVQRRTARAGKKAAAQKRAVARGKK